MKRIFRFAVMIADAVAVIAALYDYFRLDIIRYTMHSGLPGWVLELIWGWR